MHNVIIPTDLEPVVRYCKICNEEDVIACHESKCPHTFPDRNMSVMPAICKALNEALKIK